MIRDRRELLKAGGALLGAACLASCTTEAFPFDDVVVSDLGDSLVDPEFYADGPYMAWVDRDRRLWLNDLDPNTGAWHPRHGRQTLVDSSLVRVGRTRQGIEWAHAHDGPRMVYTKETPSGPWLHQARRVNGEWVPEALEGGAGLWLFQTSKDRGDRHPRVIFRQELSPTRFGWRELDDPASREWIPGVHYQVLWLDGARTAVGVDAGFRPFLYDIDSKALRPLPSPGSIEHFSPSGFRDSSGTTIVTILDDTRIGVYQERKGSWSLARTLRPESELPYVFHPKLWVHRGRPLLTFMMATETEGKVQNKRGVAEVWLASLDGSPTYRRVNDPSIRRIKDTEGVSLPGGFFVYYAQILPDRRRLIHRCRSGL